jgi:sugar O-acyltransferase (sialic acid O-acetyltransferase NeuD family)
MPTNCLYVLGTGGHAKVVIDALNSARNGYTNIRLVDDDLGKIGYQVSGRIIEDIAVIKSGDRFHVAIGSNLIRSRRFIDIESGGSKPVSVIHPKSVVAASAKIGRGVFVAASSVIGPDSTIGAGTIVNHGAVVDHDCSVGQFSHIAPGAVLGGGVIIGDDVLVGAGAVVLPSVALASGVVIGAGAVVTKSIMHVGTFIGSPARELNRGLND